MRGVGEAAGVHAFRLGTDVAIFFQSLADEAAEFIWNFRIKADRRDGRAIQNRVVENRRCVSIEGHASRGHFVEDSAEAEEVRARVEHFAASLLGRHVSHSAEGDAGAGQMLGELIGGRLGHGLRAGGFHHFREAEVENLGAGARSDEDVGRLDVAMDDAASVSGVECAGDFDALVEKQFERHGLAFDAMLQRGAVEELHGDIGLAVRVADFVDDTDIPMVERGRHAAAATQARAKATRGIARLARRWVSLWR